MPGKSSMGCSHFRLSRHLGSRRRAGTSEDTTRCRRVQSLLRYSVIFSVCRAECSGLASSRARTVCQAYAVIRLGVVTGGIMYPPVAGHSSKARHGSRANVTDQVTPVLDKGKILFD
jgi:hypothetical protein